MSTLKTDLKPSRYDVEYNIQTHNDNPNTCIKPITCQQCTQWYFNCTGRTKQ